MLTSSSRRYEDSKQAGWQNEKGRMRQPAPPASSTTDEIPGGSEIDLRLKADVADIHLEGNGVRLQRANKLSCEKRKQPGSGWNTGPSNLRATAAACHPCVGQHQASRIAIGSRATLRGARTVVRLHWRAQ